LTRAVAALSGMMTWISAKRTAGNTAPPSLNKQAHDWEEFTTIAPQVISPVE